MSAEQLLLPSPPQSSAPGQVTTLGQPRSGVRLGERADPETRRPSVLVGTDELIGAPKRDGTKGMPPVRDGVTLNLSDASINAAASAVIGDVLRQNFTVSEKVKGTITLQTPQPVSRDRLLEMFEAALQTQGAGIVIVDGTYQILPVEEAVAAGGPIRANGGSIKNVAGVSTQVVPLKYVSAGDIERLLKPIAPRNAVVRADAQRNVLILTGSRVDLASLADAVSVFDVDWMRGMSFAIYPLESADPDAIVQELDTVFANDREGGGKIVRFLPNRRLKSVLVITARKEMLGRAQSWIRKLDAVGQATTKQVHVYHVQNRPAVEIAQLLQKVYAGQDQPRANTGAAAPGPPGSTQIAPATAQPNPADTIVPGVPLTPRMPAAAAAPAGIADSILTSTAGGGFAAPATAATSAGVARPGSEGTPPTDDRLAGISIVADDQNNSIIVTATANEWRRVRQILDRIDVAPAQVLLETTIAEITLNDELKLGMRWYFERNQSQFRFSNAALAAVAPALGFSYFLNSPNVQVVLNALSTVTNVNIVSSPTLMVLDNKKATLQVGDEVPFPTQSAVGVLAPGAPIVNSITSRNTGIILGITPRISDRGRVLLDIEQEVSDAVETTSSSLTQAPTIQQRRVRTTVAVSDGESIVLAGMMQDKATRRRDQLPLLGNIPVVGNLFKEKTDTIGRTELLIAITPRIVTDRVQIRGIVDEFRNKLNFNTRPQRDTLPDRREQIDRLQR